MRIAARDCTAVSLLLRSASGTLSGQKLHLATNSVPYTGHFRYQPCSKMNTWARGSFLILSAHERKTPVHVLVVASMQARLLACLCLDANEAEKASFLGYCIRKVNLFIWNSLSEQESSKYARKLENITQCSGPCRVLFLPFGNLFFKVLRWVPLKVKTAVRYHASEKPYQTTLPKSVSLLSTTWTYLIHRTLGILKKLKIPAFLSLPSFLPYPFFLPLISSVEKQCKSRFCLPCSETMVITYRRAQHKAVAQ